MGAFSPSVFTFDGLGAFFPFCDAKRRPSFRRANPMYLTLASVCCSRSFPFVQCKKEGKRSGMTKQSVRGEGKAFSSARVLKGPIRGPTEAECLPCSILPSSISLLDLLYWYTTEVHIHSPLLFFSPLPSLHGFARDSLSLFDRGHTPPPVCPTPAALSPHGSPALSAPLPLVRSPRPPFARVPTRFRRAPLFCPFRPTHRGSLCPSFLGPPLARATFRSCPLMQPHSGTAKGVDFARSSLR